MINKFIGVGNLTREIELRKTSDNNSVATFSLAISRNYKNGNGEYDSDFLNCVAWRNTADYLYNYAHKGDTVAVSGRVQTRTYQKDGNNVYVTEVIVDEANVVRTKQRAEQREEVTQAKHEVYFDDDDLPF